MAITMDTEKQKVFTLFIVAVVGTQNFADLVHDDGWLHAAGGVHTPGETERAGFPVFSIFPFIFLLIPRYMATERRKQQCKRKKQIGWVGIGDMENYIAIEIFILR